MSNNGRLSGYVDRRQALQHDLRHALFTLRTGISLLGQVRDDPARFSDVQQLLERELGTASGLIEELLSRPDPIKVASKTDGQPSHS